MQFSPSKIWTIDRLDLQREIHNSTYYHNNRLEWRGWDGRSRKKLKVFCDDKHGNGHVNLGLV